MRSPQHTFERESLQADARDDLQCNGQAQIEREQRAGDHDHL
jgi:hypothetical protein